MPLPTRSARRLLADLVALPSVQPEGDAGGSRPGEAAMASYLRDGLRALGADVTTTLLAPGRPTVVGVFEPAAAAQATVVLAPHLDTVGVQGMTVPPFRLTARGGRLHGRGACDTKGPTAALLAALARWTCSAAVRRNRVRWIVAATAGEEQGSLGAQALLRTTGLAADFAVALEPTQLRVVHACKGVLRLAIETTGRAAHGSRPDRGVNAIERMVPIVLALQRSVTPRLQRRVHPLLGPATLNLGVMTGGQDINIVPDRCRIGLDIRTHPGCSGAAAQHLVAAACARVAPHARLSCLREGGAFVTAKDSPWARRLRRVGRGWAVADWFCDANIFAAHGIPAVAFGPGNIAQAHTRDEFITEDDLRAGEEAFFKFLTGDARADAGS